LTGWAGLFAAICSGFVLFAGFIQIFGGLGPFLAAFLPHGVSASPDSPPDKAALIRIIHGIEFFLLAPLPYLILNSVAKYVHDWEFEGEVSVRTRGKVLEAKLLLIGLFFGILTADFIAKLFSNSLQVSGGTLQLLLLVLLTLFFFGLEVLIGRGRHAAPEPRAERPAAGGASTG
jgi:hypothetical protein